MTNAVVTHKYSSDEVYRQVGIRLLDTVGRSIATDESALDAYLAYEQTATLLMRRLIKKLNVTACVPAW